MRNNRANTAKQKDNEQNEKPLKADEKSIESMLMILP
jgi:hypothetical protein